jgi:hypothetical protein
MKLMLVKEIIAGYCENHTEHTDTLYGRTGEISNVKTGGIYSYHKK